MKIKRSIKSTISILIILWCVLFLYGCKSNDLIIIPSTQVPSETPTPLPKESNDPSSSIVNTTEITPLPKESLQIYINSEGDTLESRIYTPDGFHRTPSSENELTHFLRNYLVKADTSAVLLFDNTPKSYQSGHVAVFDMSVGNRDLQQCADSIIRIYAEYFWSIEAYDNIKFHLTNGFLMEYTKWRDGNRIVVEGNDVRWSKTKSYDNSYESFVDYLETVFIYAGTLSLTAETTSIEIESLRPGDMFLYGGSPGHCVLVVDMAVNEAGDTSFLLAQGYMPAQDFHIIKNPLHPEDPWYYVSELTYPFETPSWIFEEGSLVRWADFLEISEANKSQSVTFLAVGDNLIHTEVIESGLQENGSYQFDHLYSLLTDTIISADIAVINQETIFAGPNFPYIGYPNFNSPTEIGDAVINTGFDVVLHATNHTMDKGYKGLLNTFDYWAKHPNITVLGINETKEDRRDIPLIEKNGIKIAMLNYTYGLNGHKLPSDKPYLVNMIDINEMKVDIQKAKTLADFVIVFPHWGEEYIYEPSTSQKDLTQFFYNQGVDLVIGTHPHVLEPVEWIQTNDDHKMLVYYSLGNFISYQKEAPRMLGGIASLTITKSGEETYIENPQIIPIVTHYEHGPSNYNYGIYPLKDYTNELALRHGVNNLAQRGPFTYNNTYALAQDVLDTWFE